MRAGGIRLGMLLVVGMVLAGCGALFGTVTQRSSSSSCENMAGGACQEQVDRIAARHPGATQIDLKCSVQTCDRSSGAGTAVVTLPDGTSVNEVFTYVGVQGAVPPPTCRGLPVDVCKSVADGQVDGVPPSKVVVAIDVTCTSTTCTTEKGETDVTLTLADGSKQEGSVGWEGAAGP